METPKFETPIAELSEESLRLTIEDGQRNLLDLFVEVEKNPNPKTRELAKEQAHQQLEAILEMMEKQGEKRRERIARLKINEDTSMDAGRFEDTWRQQSPE